MITQFEKVFQRIVIREGLFNRDLPPGGEWCFCCTVRALVLIKTKEIHLTTYLALICILASVSVEGVIVGPQLWHLPWRPVHRHRIWRQESYSLWGDLLNSDWLKKGITRVWGEGFPCTSDCTERQGSTPTLFFCLCLREMRDGEKQRGTKSHLWKSTDCSNDLLVSL